MIGLILLHLVLNAFSYLFTCGLVRLVTLCFGWTFSWAIATGIWLILILLRLIFNK